MMEVHTSSGRAADDHSSPSPNNTENDDDVDEEEDEEKAMGVTTTRPPSSKTITTPSCTGGGGGGGDGAVSSSASSSELSSSSSSSWNYHVTKTIRRLRAAPPSPDYAPEIRTQVLAVLELWATDNYFSKNEKYRSFLHKRTLTHEMEECLPALHHLNEWRKKQHVPTTTHQQQPQRRFVAVDVCGGKGYFAMLAQYCASLYWNNHDNDGAMILDRVILLDKQQQQRSSSGGKDKKKDGRINWNHLTTHDASPTMELVPIVLWDDCNLHETDALVDRLLQIENTSGGVNNTNNHHDTKTTSTHSPPLLLALTGIHLCKMLSPALVGLVNRLGPARCPYLCLVPCCLPRAVTRMGRNKKKKNMADDHDSPPASSLVRVFSYETPDARAARLQRVPERHGALQGNSATSCCYGCQSPEHVLRDCPVAAVTMTKQERQRMFRQQQAPTPCWKCGLPGHFQVDCPVRQDRSGSHKPPPPQQQRDHHPLWKISSSPLEPPIIFLDCTHVLASPDPLRTYCDLLLGTLDGSADDCCDNKNNNGEVEDRDPNVLSDTEPQPATSNHPTQPTAASSYGTGGWSSRRIHETQLVGKLEAGQQPGNWNGQRKSLYIVAQTH